MEAVLLKYMGSYNGEGKMHIPISVKGMPRQKFFMSAVINFSPGGKIVKRSLKLKGSFDVALLAVAAMTSQGKSSLSLLTVS